METTLLGALAKNWWAIALRGVLAMLFALLTFAVPGVTLTVLVLLFGAYAVVEGILNIIGAVRGGGGRWWALVLEGVVSIVAGVVALVVPGLTALALVYVIAAWAILTGVLEIAAAIVLRRVVTGEWWLALGGALSVIFGGFILVFPGAGALALVLWIGAYAFVFGVLLVALAFRLRRHSGAAYRAVPHAV